MPIKGQKTTGLTGNRLLDLLSSADRRRIGGQLELRELKIKDAIFRQNETVKEVCFPVDAILAYVIDFKCGTNIEVATIGSEGMIGINAFLGSKTSPMHTFCQVDGSALFWSASSFLKEWRRNPKLEQAMKLYAQFMIWSLAQCAACNREHSIEQRCARWLLTHHDRAKRDEFPLTHEFMARMLGVRRATVTEIASALQKKGLIQYRWRMIRIADRAGLEAVACECYRSDLTNYDRLFRI